MRKGGPLPLALLCLALLSGCGGGGEEQATTTPPRLIEGPKPPDGASALVKELYRNFPPPKPDPEAHGSGQAIARGEAACKGKTPKQVIHRYAPEAKLSPEQRRALRQIESAEAHPTGDFVAGQLAALAYEGTLGGGALEEYGYRGCVFVLARGVGVAAGPRSP